MRTTGVQQGEMQARLSALEVGLSKSAEVAVEQAEKRCREVIQGALAEAIDERVKQHTNKAMAVLEQKVTAKLQELETLAQHQRDDAKAQVRFLSYARAERRAPSMEREREHSLGPPSWR